MTRLLFFLLDRFLFAHACFRLGRERNDTPVALEDFASGPDPEIVSVFRQSEEASEQLPNSAQPRRDNVYPFW